MALLIFMGYSPQPHGLPSARKPGDFNRQLYCYEPAAVGKAGCRPAPVGRRWFPRSTDRNSARPPAPPDPRNARSCRCAPGKHGAPIPPSGHLPLGARSRAKQKRNARSPHPPTSAPADPSPPAPPPPQSANRNDKAPCYQANRTAPHDCSRANANPRHRTDRRLRSRQDSRRAPRAGRRRSRSPAPECRAKEMSPA